MKKIIILFTLFIYIVILHAQVTIGSDTPPESFSLLQIEGEQGGVLLPNLTSTQMDALSQNTIFKDNAKAEGLMAYNSDSAAVVFWDGTIWHYLYDNYQIVAQNGLNLTDPDLKLGGSLLHNTEIDQNNLLFNVDLGTSTGSLSLSVNTTDLNIKRDTVRMKPAGGVTIYNQDQINANTAHFNLKSFDVASTVGPVLNQSDGKLTFKDVALDFTPKSSYMLALDPATKKVSWEPLRPFSSYFNGDIVSSKNIGYNTVDVVTSKLSLLSGQYLIFGQVTTEQTATSSILYNWIGLIVEYADGVSETFRVNGVLPEIKTAGTAFSTPFFKYYLNLKQPAKVSVYINSGNQSNNHLYTGGTSYLGGPAYFKAIRIDVADFNAPD